MSKTILFVEDDEDDREFLAQILKDINPSVHAVFAENGLKAIEYLRRSIDDCLLPCLIVLDLNMPFLDGKATYKKIKDDLKLDAVPIIIFTSSRNPNDKMLFTTLGVEFITKPDDIGFFNKVVSHMVSVCGSRG